ncbi:MAG: hypothetical protein K6F73_09940 [Lachnospiraceae bacterium]|nr:hypothetical protein [Lachnospiraceae bacterium]
MKKTRYDGRGAEQNTQMDWVQLSEQMDRSEGKKRSGYPAGRNEPGSDDIVNETISQIVSEGLKVDTSDLDGVKDAVDAFYAYDRPKKKKNPVPVAAEEPEMPADDPEAAIRRSVDEKIIIRSEELKKKRKSAGKTAAKSTHEPSSVKKKKKHAGPTHQSDSFRHKKGLEKYRKAGILPTKKDGPSEFRKESAKWRYDSVPKAEMDDNAPDTEEESLTDRLKKLTPVQWGAVAMAAVIVITSVMTTTVYADYRGEQNKAMAMANLPYFVDDASLIAYDDTEALSEEVEMEEAAEQMTDSEGKMLSLILTSVEKDLKVKLVDEDDTLVKGLEWGITVTDKDDKESSYEDEDEDGIIHLTGMSAGDYSVTITESDSLSGYVYPTVGQKVSVKAKVEYKVIANIKDEIKKESEVNAAVEDNGNKHADVETGTAPKDTVEFVESTVEEVGESYEEATVDLSKTEIIASIFSRLFAALGKVADSVGFSSGATMANIGLAPAGRLVATEVQLNETSDTPTDDTDDPTPTPTDTPTPTPTDTPTPTPTPTPTDTPTPTPTPTPTDTPTPTPTPTESPTPTPVDLTPPSEIDKYKPEAQLFDSNKNKLYVNEDGTYRLAKIADLRSGNFSVFYRRIAGFIYTGWQNIDGKTYYYTKDHEFVTGDQVIGGVSYHFNSDGTLDTGSGVLGIDVSKYQPSINWGSVKASGIDFVIIRCGYRGASTGALIEDPYFKSHIKGAKSAGLKVGVYFFSTALNEAEAVEEASMCAALCGGYGLNYPVFLDVESSSRPGYNTLSASQRTENIQAFCKTIASAGYTPGLYANKTWLTEKINTSSLSCKIWLAQYRAEGPTYSGRYDIWQYTSKGSVSGISGNVDMNKSFLRY